MEEQNSNVTQNPIPVNLNRKAPHYFVVAALFVIAVGILAYFLFFKNIIPFKLIPTKSPVATEAPLITIKTKAYGLSDEKGVQIYLSSNTKTVEVSAFQIKFLLPNGISKDNLTIKINPQLEAQAWKFPIARLEEENDIFVVKLSGFRLGNSPYVIQGNLLIATVYKTTSSTEDEAGLTLTLDSENTLLYSSDAVTNIPFDTSAE